MTPQTFTIPGALPALNEMIGNAKTHWAAYKKERDAALFKAGVAIRAAKLRGIPSFERIVIETDFYCPNQRKDPSNLSAGFHKIVEDQLQTEGILANDGFKNVGGYVERFRLDRDNPRIEVTLRKETV